jgi:hypothetical protein
MFKMCDADNSGRIEYSLFLSLSLSLSHATHSIGTTFITVLQHKRILWSRIFHHLGTVCVQGHRHRSSFAVVCISVHMDVRVSWFFTLRSTTGHLRESDKSGTVSPSELDAMVRKMKIALSPSNVMKVFKHVDRACSSLLSQSHVPLHSDTSHPLQIWSLFFFLRLFFSRN